MKYRIIKYNKLIEVELEDADAELYSLVDNKTNKSIYKNDIIRIDGVFEHTIWYGRTKRSSGKPSTYKIKGYAIYEVTEGGDLYYNKLKLLKCEHDTYNIKGNLFYLANLKPQIYDWYQKDTINVIGNTHFSNVEKLVESNSL